MWRVGEYLPEAARKPAVAFADQLRQSLPHDAREQNGEPERGLPVVGRRRQRARYSSCIQDIIPRSSLPTFSMACSASRASSFVKDGRAA